MDRSGRGGTVAAELARSCAGCEATEPEMKEAAACPCALAVARRQIDWAVRSGDDPGLLDAARRGELLLQTWAAGPCPDEVSASIVEAVLRQIAAEHPSCSLPGCLRCAARDGLARVLASLSREPCAESE